MARARNIKPGFFENEDLAELPVAARLLFIGLWTQADREGRLEDRPKRIKMQLLPMDDVDVDGLLQQLHDAGFIYRYGVSTRQVRCKHQRQYIQILKFSEHQSPHCKEKASTIPAPDKYGASTGQADKGKCDAPPDSLNPDSLNPDKNPRSPADANDRFDEFWAEYPRRVAKAKAKQIWKSRKLHTKLDDILADLRRREACPTEWREKRFVPHPTTYLNQERWNDEIDGVSPDEGVVVAAYRAELPHCPGVDIEVWRETDGPSLLYERWNEREEHQDADWWCEFFRFAATTKVAQGINGWFPDLNWLLDRENFYEIAHEWANQAEAA